MSNVLGREPPTAVADLLRAEVGYRCPMDGCSSPFLSFHHFDPPWEIENHHRPEGMIALCAGHASTGDGSHLTKQQYQTLKRNPRALDFQHPLPWKPEAVTFLLGNTILVGQRCALRMFGVPIFGAKRLDAPFGTGRILSFDGSLMTPTGEPVLRLDDNTLLFNTRGIARLRATTRQREVSIRHESGVSMDLRIDYPSPREFRKRLQNRLKLSKDRVAIAVDLAATFGRDSDGRLPVVTIHGRFQLPGICVEAGERHTRVQIAGFGKPTDFGGGPMINPNGVLKFVSDDNKTEMIAFGGSDDPSPDPHLRQAKN